MEAVQHMQGLAVRPQFFKWIYPQILLQTPILFLPYTNAVAGLEP
jgi:hypothetical protein